MMRSTGAKKLQVAICTPTAGTIHAAYCMSLTRMILYYLQTPVLAQEYTEKGVTTHMYVGANIGENRDKMADKAIEIGATHVLFIDDDMGFMPECLNIALARQMPIVLANYRRKCPPGRFTARNADNTSDIKTTVDSTSLTECYFGGFGFCLIEIDVFKQVKKPRFLAYYDEKTNSYTTEDRPFFDKVHEAGIPVFCDQEISKRVWHNGNFAYTFDQELKPEWELPYPERVGISDEDKRMSR